MTGGQDGLLKIWNYDEGVCYYEGEGHSGSITKIKIAPDQKTIISVGNEGAMFLWTTPSEGVEDGVE